MNMNMRKKVFGGLFLGALFSAAFFAGEAHAQAAPPTALTYEPTPGRESSAVNLSWMNGGNTITHHSISLRSLGALRPTATVIDNRLPSGAIWEGRTISAGRVHPDATGGVVSGLMPATTYQVQMRAYYIVPGFLTPAPVNGSWSETLQVATLSMDTPLPVLSPRLVTSEPGMEKWRIQLQWSIASGFGTVANWHVRWRASAQDPDGTPGNADDVAAGAWQNASGDDADCADGASAPENCGEELSAATSRYLIQNLPAETDYDFEVRAEKSGGGFSGWSNRLTFTVEQLSDDADLSALALADGGGNAIALTPAFDKNTTNYTAEIRNVTSNLDITATASAAGTSAIEIGRKGFEAAATGGAASRQTIDKAAGAARQDPEKNTFRIRVTAEDSSVKIYEIAVTRLQANTDASLSALAVSAHAGLRPAFAPETLSYRTFLRNTLTSVAFDIFPTAADAGASIKVGRAGFLAGVASGQRSRQGYDESGGTAGNTNTNIFLIEVTAEDGAATRTYTIQLIRQPLATDSALLKLEISHGELQPAFNPDITSYNVAGANFVQFVGRFGITPTATLGDPVTKTVKVGVAGSLSGHISPGATSTQDAHRGANVYLVEVTSEDSMRVTTYTIRLFRPANFSKLEVHDASLPANQRTAENSLLFTSAVPPATILDRTRDKYFVATTAQSVVITVAHNEPGGTYRPPGSSSLFPFQNNAPTPPITLGRGLNVIKLNISGPEYEITILRSPPAPAGLTVSPQRAKLLARWTRGSAPVVTGYRVRWRLKDAGGGAPGAWQSAGGDDENGEAVADFPLYRIRGLTDGAAYEVAVRGVNAAGGGEWSAAAEGTPSATAFEFASAADQPDLAFAANETLAAGAGVVLGNAVGGATPHTFTLTGLPAGLAFDASSREITGTPGAAAAPVEVVYRVTDNMSVTDEQRFRVGVLESYLNVAEDGADGINPADGIVIARYLLGVRGAALTAGQSELGAPRLEAAVQAGVRGMELDANENGAVDGDDGILIARYLLGLRGADLIAGFSNLDAAAIAAKIAGLMP